MNELEFYNKYHMNYYNKKDTYKLSSPCLYCSIFSTVLPIKLRDENIETCISQLKQKIPQLFGNCLFSDF